MNCWRILEIAQTPDARAIKRAYAKKLKVTQPDVHPSAFQQLHAAYKTALNYASYAQQNQRDEEREEERAEVVYAPDQQDAKNHYEQPNTAPETPQHLEPVVRQLEAEDTNESIAKTGIAPPEPTQARPESPHLQPIIRTLETDEETSVPLTSAAPEPTTSARARLTELQTDQHSSDDFELPPLDPEANRAPAIDPLQYEGEQLIALTRELLATRSEFHDVDRWKFLAGSAFILDDAFNWRLGLAVLQLLIDHEHIYKRVNYYQFSGALLTYLDSLFNWNANRAQVYAHLDRTACDHLLDRIVETVPYQQTAAGLRGAKSVKLVFENRQPIATYFFPSSGKRGLACLVDLVLIWLICIPLNSGASALLAWARGPEPELPPLAIFGLLLLLGNWLCESSRFQTTPGKKLFGLIVTNKDFQRLPYWQGFWRSLVFAVSCFGFYITLLINAMMGDKMIHDRLSKSYVFDMRKTRAEHNRKQEKR